ncbi:AMP-binding enzyme domain protein [Tolypothrix tenuis PCC 7101]|uniref:AMP-binding enzyme domain protein n=1 Tax=Tolypothrix tenuis PCC 7101 TaxID=231146 RepID=A0A1Z4N1P7_9CYAN|nr:AMP-binding protein [Aulosira sp. FACHB-113]BAY99624.1 AMP-binding enzyme domain protein [Tolypothrix tenuis PCC 7101]BAZ76454.1 AMP-binding enzyme domain protein [Aulosira laxa NIES-50]
MAIQDLQDRATSIFGTSTNLTIEQLIIDGVRQNPGARAIAAPARLPLTYARLYEHLQDIRTTLNTLGLGVGDRVAIVLPNGPEMATAFLTVAACATSAPLNPAYSAEQFEFYLDDLNAKALIVQSGIDSIVREVAAARNLPIIELTPKLEAEAGIFELSGETHLPPIKPTHSKNEDTALVLHTSGTTVRPKIVPLTQANLYIAADIIKKALELEPNDCCLNVMPLFHVQGLFISILSSIAAGGSVACAPGFDSLQFFDWLQNLQVTWYSSVPTIHQAVLNAATQNNIKNIPKLRFIRSGGAALPRPVMRAIEELFQAPILEGYGMTETGCIITLNPLPPRQRKPGSVGIATGMKLGIMDATGNLLPPHEIGEIVVQGGHVMHGYENNPVANQNSFLNGWFRSGDQGYLDDEGYLFLTGRLKEQINRGGEKIAPREIDDILLEHPAVAQAVAFAVPHPTLGEDLAAAIVLHPNVTITDKELREFVATKLAGFKVPNQILFVEDIPKGSTGKLQRIGLAKKLQKELKTNFVAPRTELETALAQIWAEVLNLQQVGIYDNFFALGGDSLLAVTLFNKIEQKLGYSLPLSTLVPAPTIEQFAAVLSQAKSAVSSSSLVAIHPQGSRPPLFLVHAVWGNVLLYRDFARYLHPEQPVYALQAKGLDGQQAPITDLRQMAANYIQEIRQMQPHGPYYLGGYSFGGIIGFEMAQQLQAQGEEIALVAIFDVSSPGYAKPIPNSHEANFFHLRKLLNLNIQDQLTYVWERLAWHFQIGKMSMFYKFYLRYLKRSLPDLRLLEVASANNKAGKTYIPSIYPDQVTLFRASQQNVGLDVDPELGWGKLAAGGVELYDVPGSHASLISEPHVQVLAKKFQVCLDRAQFKIRGS